MRSFVGAGVLFCTMLAGAQAEEAIPVQTLTRIKDATVFVKTQFGRLEKTGSGFVFRVDGRSVLVATNHHVVSVPPTLARARPRLSLVFRSGTRAEQEVNAEVVATDPSRDLAVLKATAVKEIPQPIPFSTNTELVETMPVFVFGFPFGSALATSRRSPAITVGRGSVSSIRRDDRDEVAIVQIHGDLNPGNSGGPVVDARGNLVGVAVATISGTQIGLAIPPSELAALLNGRVNTLALTVTAVDSRTTRVGVVAELIDPLNKLKAVSVLILPGDRSNRPLKPGADGHWDALPGARKVALKIDRQEATGEFQVPTTRDKVPTYLVQTVFVSGDGKAHYTQPLLRRIERAAPESRDVAKGTAPRESRGRPGPGLVGRAGANPTGPGRGDGELAEPSDWDDE